jgi:hypothetical protein
MANYVAHYTKKLGILLSKERNLLRLLEKGAAQSRLLTAAEAVRDARIRAEHARAARLSPADTPQRDRALERIARRIEVIRGSTSREIVIELQSRRP